VTGLTPQLFFQQVGRTISAQSRLPGKVRPTRPTRPISADGSSDSVVQPICCANKLRPRNRPNRPNRPVSRFNRPKIAGESPPTVRTVRHRRRGCRGETSRITALAQSTFGRRAFGCRLLPSCQRAGYRRTPSAAASTVGYRHDTPHTWRRGHHVESVMTELQTYTHEGAVSLRNSSLNKRLGVTVTRKDSSGVRKMGGKIFLKLLFCRNLRGFRGHLIETNWYSYFVQVSQIENCVSRLRFIRCRRCDREANLMGARSLFASFRRGFFVVVQISTGC
jgi:hypothetical protein